MSSGPAQSWQAFSGQTTIQTAGLYTVNFQFNTNFIPAKDVVIDRAYVAAVPEPASWAMLIAGFGLIRTITAKEKPRSADRHCGVFHGRRRDQKSLRSVTKNWRGAAGNRVWLSPAKRKPLEPMVAT